MLSMDVCATQDTLDWFLRMLMPQISILLLVERYLAIAYLTCAFVTLVILVRVEIFKTQLQLLHHLALVLLLRVQKFPMLMATLYPTAARATLGSLVMSMRQLHRPSFPRPA
jgi:hypothetical protein